MNAEIITIGDEILIGQTIDTNSAWIAQQLNQIGVCISQSKSISDNRESIIKALNQVEDETALVLMTGGLGPTKDDITKRVLTEYFGTELKRNSDVLQKIDDYFIQRGRDVLESNRRQADLPIAATILHNPLGTASGMWFEKNGKIFVSMPGVPYEMKGLVRNEVMPRLKEKFILPSIYYRTVMTEGVGESFLADQISDWEDSLSDKNISIAYLPSPGIVKIRLGAKGDSKTEIQEKVDREIENLYQLIPNYIFGENDISPEDSIAVLLKEKMFTLTTAESCTGGYLAHLLTSVPGSSEYFLGSIISYSNEIKEAELAVAHRDIEEHGAVSKEVVEQMARGARTKLKSDIALATSGVAGPDGGTDEKPVGTVWIAIAAKEGVYSKQFTFEKNRSRNIRRSALAAISMLRRYLNGQIELN